MQCKAGTIQIQRRQHCASFIFFLLFTVCHYICFFAKCLPIYCRYLATDSLLWRPLLIFFSFSSLSFSFSSLSVSYTYTHLPCPRAHVVESTIAARNGIHFDEKRHLINYLHLDNLIIMQFGVGYFYRYAQFFYHYSSLFFRRRHSSIRNLHKKVFVFVTLN